MDNQRLLIFVVFALSLYFLWAGWEQEQAKLRAPVVATATSDVPTAPAAAPAAQNNNAAVPGAVAEVSTAPDVAPVIIKTDLYEAQISPVGGVIKKMALLTQPDAEDKSKPYLVMQSDPNGRYLVAQSGLVGADLPNHYTTYEVLSTQRELQNGENSFQLRLGTTAKNGDKVEQILTFHRASYVIDVTMKVTNTSAVDQTPTAYFQFTRDAKEATKRTAMAPAAYYGPVLYDDVDKFTKVDFAKMDAAAHTAKPELPYQATNNNGWIAMIEHYFVTAWALPDNNQTQRTFFTRSVGDGKYAAGLTVPMPTIAPGASAEITMPMYAGPQDQNALSAISEHLNLVVDYGVFTVIAAPMFWLVKFFFNLIGNWGWAIIAMTIVIRLVFFPLNAAAARSMGKMRLMAPKMKAIQEQFKDDKQQMQMRLMELYKQEKINPLGGCLPILIQMPFFIALYWVLLSAAELRYAPWFGWIQDLSAPDPWFILPILYAISAFLQMKLSPTPTTDKAQARMIQMMPVIFAVLFVFFPAGLVLYWFVSNLFQIGQQWYMNRVLERDAAARAAAHK